VDNRVPRIGVTGHAHLVPGTARLVYDALRAALSPYRDLSGVTCLAEGADQLFARAVLDVGGTFEVILPATDYRTAKVKPDNRDTFNELLGKASDVLIMPYTRSGPEAYRAAGMELIGRSDRMVAVWDGEASGAVGGTADMVRAARHAGLTVDVIWPAGAARVAPPTTPRS
jgi:hypothetical protein